MNICRIPGCIKSRPYGRTLCSAHRQQHWRRTHPVAAQYARLKAKAKSRGKRFDLSKQDWALLCEQSGYHEGTVSSCGDFRLGLSIDRINPRLGYTITNLRVIPMADNSGKGGGPDRQLLNEPDVPDLEALLERF